MRKTIMFPNLTAEMIRNEDTHYNLAKVLGISYGSICRRLNGVTEFSKSEIDKLCEYYNKDYNELFKKSKRSE